MRSRVAFAICLFGASGCGQVPLEVIDAGAMNLLIDAPVDRAATPDAPRSPDAGSPIDAPAPMDAGSPIDAGAPMDAGSPRDVLAPIDLGSPRDVGSPVDAPVPLDNGRCVYEPVYVDAFGDPRNAAGQIRNCWPGEALCFCDRDNDCYAQAGYVPRCSPAGADAGARVDVGAPRDVPVVTDVPPRDAGTIPSGDPVAYSGSFPTSTGRNTVTIRVNGHAREVVVYSPPTRASSPALIMLFHGTGGNGDGIFTESDAQAVATANGAVVVAPTARDMPSGDWDHTDGTVYWETYPNTDPSSNEDLLLTRAIIVEARRAFNVDAGRVYALGHSNGAFFATLVASVLAERIAGFATSSGGINRCANTWSCSFQGSGSTCAALSAQSGWCSCAGAPKPVTLRSDGLMPPGYFIHATNDNLVSVYYTCALQARMMEVGAVSQTVLRGVDGHYMPPSFVSQAWGFLGSRRR